LIAAIHRLETEAITQVTVTNAWEVTALTADALKKVDEAESAVLSVPLMEYTVTVVDADGNTLTNVGEGTYAYGTSVTINAGEGAYKYDYVSNTGNTDGTHQVKNIGTVDSFTFNVQGNTTVTVGAPTDNRPIKVTYRANLAGDTQSPTFVIGTDYVADDADIDVNAVKAPSYAFYKLDSITKGAVKDNEVTVTLNYSLAGDSLMYVVKDMENNEEHNVYFNELVTLNFRGAEEIVLAESEDDAYYYFDIIELRKNRYYPYAAEPEEGIETEYVDGFDASIKYTPVSYTGTYTFRAREDLYVLPIYELERCEAGNHILKQQNETTNADGVYARTVANVNTDSHALVTYNSIALPEDYEIVEAGLLVQYNKAGDNLLPRTSFDFNEVGQDNGNDKVRRLKASKVFAEEDNRYSITLNLAAGAKVKYRAYVNYLDDQGNAHTVMSDASDVVTIG
jgi:hypothetical protein